MKKEMQSENLPTLAQLLTGPVTLNCLNGCHRQLRAANLYDDVAVRLSLQSVSEEGDGAEWAEYRRNLGSSSVVCPECESSGDGPDGCEFCAGRGMVSRTQWDEWYYSEKDCRRYVAGCELLCKEKTCPRDLGSCAKAATTLVLEVKKKGGSWVEKGNSLYGFKLVGLCKNRPALERFMALVVESTAVMCFDADDGE